MAVMNYCIVIMNSVLSCVVLFLVFVGIAADAVIEGYFWKDFNGVIPPYALRGGTDSNNKPIYMGQALFQKFLIPAKIYSDGRVYFDYGRTERTPTASVKILCALHPEQFEWIATSLNSISLITDKKLVIGGYDEPGTTTYIGRVRVGEEIAIGKVLTDISEDNAGLHVTRDGVSKQHASFEVLAFNAVSAVSAVPTVGVGGFAGKDCKQVSISFFSVT